MTKAQIFRKLVELKNQRYTYLESIPSDIQQAIFDNKAMDTLERAQDMLINEYFAEDAEAVFWFLYDWEPGFLVGINGTNTKINNIEDYITWMKWND
jgi:hypothetical protein